jgi:hypothetical protein
MYEGICRTVLSDLLTGIISDKNLFSLLPSTYRECETTVNAKARKKEKKPEHSQLICMASKRELFNAEH